MNKLIKRLLDVYLVLFFSLSGTVFADNSQLDLNDLVLPSETSGVGKASGSIYFSPAAKNKTLMPIHFWGEVGRPGLHFIPVDTNLIKGLSLAGGGNSSADLDEVIVNRRSSGNIRKKEFDLTSGGDVKAHDFVLEPGDTVFIKKDRYVENRNFYIGLTSVVMTILTSVLLYKRIEEMK